MEEDDRSSTLSRNCAVPSTVEKDGLMRGGVAANHHGHPPTSRSSSDSDFWTTVAGVAGNVLEWYDFAGMYELNGFLILGWYSFAHSFSVYLLAPCFDDGNSVWIFR